MFTTTSGRSGIVQVQQSGSDGFSAFIPHPLPPDPPLEYDDEIKDLASKASLALGRLDGSTYILPSPELFMFAYARKEAVLSSQIEGTQASMTDLLEYEDVVEHKSYMDEVKEVVNYLDAMNYGLERLGDFPLSLRLINEIHAKLMDGARGGNKSPGVFRKSQNWVAGSMPSNANYVPPPPHEVMGCMGELEKFIHDRSVPALIKAGMAHAQFETIHPYLDGNGRVGRLLITFILCHDRVLEKPLLYLSLYFKRNRDEYYALLNAVRRDGVWEDWMKFYLRGVYEISIEATETVKKILNLLEQDRRKIMTLKRASHTVLKLHEMLSLNPLTSVPGAARRLKISPPAARKAVGNLERMGILREISGKKKGKLYVYDEYLELVDA